MTAPIRHWQPYTPGERGAILHALTTQDVTRVARTFGRTVDAIQRVSAEAGLDVRSHVRRSAGMTRADVADALGVQLSTIARWQREGLPVRRVGTRRYFRSIDPDALLVWLRAGNVYHVAIQPTDPAWREIVQEICAELRYLTRRDVTNLLMLAKHSWLPPDFPPPAWPQPPILPSRLRPSHYAPADVRAWFAAHPERQTPAARAWMRAEEARG